jgi:hypothetical protein
MRLIRVYFARIQIKVVRRLFAAGLGHRNIQHTVRYTELSPMRFKNFWRE